MIVLTDTRPQDNEEKLSRELFKEQMDRLQEAFGHLLKREITGKQLETYWHELKPIENYDFMLAVNRIVLNNHYYPCISDFKKQL